jgi:hypothetical protein
MQAHAELAETKAKGKTATDAPAGPRDDEDPLLLPADAPAVHPCRIPVFTRRFRDAIPRLPDAVVRHAMTLIGRLAAGEQGAFLDTRRIRLRHDVVRKRVGASHRLLFRLSDTELEVLDLIARRDLESTLKTMP